MNHRIRALFSALAVCFALAACGSGKTTPDTGTSSGSADAATAVPDAGPTCFTNPKTHVEIINACTSSPGIAKNPSLPLLLADGGLPPLP
jgi:hypothetical protein